MSETKPKRASPEQAPSEIALGKTPTEAPVIPGVPAEAPALPVDPIAAAVGEQLSVVALAEAVPAGPACPLPVSQPMPPGGAPAEPAVEDFWAAFTAAQAALARGAERIAIEMTTMSRSGIAAATDAAVALLGARTVAEAVEINAGLARRGADSMLESSARLSEIAAGAVTDAYRPILAKFTGSSSDTAAD